ncbi:hypothetical protein RRG08_021194 [Elysia crispata]|uniref:Uncharacterized protein n=1 Tax=Elysia crispata TaxID=231223 RepID=A0AAE1D239_9GAST|nr:hypothetical protein RRG08_021194 [Elysia crispata]
METFMRHYRDSASISVVISSLESHCIVHSADFNVFAPTLCNLRSDLSEEVFFSGKKPTPSSFLLQAQELVGQKGDVGITLVTDPS